MTQPNETYRTAPLLSAISTADLGVKAGFLSESDGEITFRQIVGWVTVPNYVQAAKQPFVAVVLGENGYPTLASPPFFSDFIGVFDKELSAERAMEVFRARPAATLPPSTASAARVGDRPVE